MASRSTWKGAVQFGMVVMPVKIYNSVSDGRKDTATCNLHVACGTRLQQPKYCPTCDRKLEGMTEVVKGYEVGKEQYLQLTEADLATLPLPSAGTVNIDRFVKVADLEDPRWITDTYFVVPDKVGTKAFALFRAAMDQENVVGISKIAMRAGSPEKLCCLRAYCGLMTLHTLHWSDELKDTDEFMVNADVTDRELAMATTLVRSMVGPFEPEKFTDKYKEAFTQLIEAKLAGETIAPAPVAQSTENDDLFAALEKSLAAVGAGK